MKKKRVETFRKIYGMVTVVYIYISLLLYRQRAQVVRLGGLAPARPIIQTARAVQSLPRANALGNYSHT